MFKGRKKKKDKDKEGTQPPLRKINMPVPPKDTILPPPPSIRESPLSELPKHSLPKENAGTPFHSMESVPIVDPIVLQELELKMKEGTLSKGLTKVDTQAIPKRVASLDKKLEKDIADYIETAKKWEESGLLPNAAIAFACAALTSYIAQGAAEAAKMLVGFAKTSNPNVVNHPAFQSAKSLLLGVIKRDTTLLSNAARLLQGISFQFEEDREVFRMAIGKTREYLLGKK
ncbi:MAG: hypothetical protein ACFFC7_16250 [Candidatus Hermodarchaeota archaeon]